MTIPLTAITAEADVADYLLLNSATRQFLTTMKPAVEYGREVLEKDPIDWKFLESSGFSKSQIEAALQICWNQIDSLAELAKFVALLYKSRRCLENQRLDWLLKAKVQAEQIATSADPEFSSGLFLRDLGNALYYLGRYEEAIAAYDKALEVKPDDHEAWYNRGMALGNLGRYEKAIAAYDKALEAKPDKHEAWNNRGNALGNLGRYEEEIAAYDKALEVKPDKHEAWNNRGNALYYLGRYEEEIAAYDKALEVKPDKHEAWNNRGNALYYLGRYEEEIAAYDKALEIKPDDDSAIYNKACCYAIQGNADLAIEHLQQAINLNPDKNREMAKTDSDFDSIRDDERFQQLIQG